MTASSPPRILITGALGQVGWELQRSLAGLGEITAVDLAELDIANAYSGNLGLRHADLFGLSVGLDATGFTNGYTEGGLVTARLGRRFAAGHLVDLSYGYSTYRVKLTEQDRTAQWLRLLGRAELPRRLYVQGDFGYDTGDDRRGPRAFLEVGVLF